MMTSDSTFTVRLNSRFVSYALVAVALCFGALGLVAASEPTTLTKDASFADRAKTFLTTVSFWSIAFYVSLLTPIVLAVLTRDGPNAPPRFPYLFRALTGKFGLKTWGPFKMLMQGYKECGEVFRIRIGHKNITFVVGPEANDTFFTAPDKILSQQEVYKFTVPVFGKNIVYDAEPKVMFQQLNMVSSGLKGDILEEHCKKIVKEVEEFFGRWDKEQDLDLLAELSELTINTASRCLLGDEIRDRMQSKFALWYEDLNAGMQHISVFFPNFPIEAHRKRDAARDKIIAMFEKVIIERRKQGEKASLNNKDFMQMLMDAKYKNGNKPTNREVMGLLLAALFAGQHTSSITSTWVGYLIYRHRDQNNLLKRLVEEQRTVLTKYDGVITLDALAEMKLLHFCMKETLRLYPPLVLLMRYVRKDIKVKGFTVPKGDIIMAAPPITHRMESLYKDPESFNPDRWFEYEKKGQELPKWSYIAFGGSRHACRGEHFAFLQIKTIWSVLLRNFDFTLVGEEPRCDYTAVVAGPTHFKMHCKPLEKPIVIGEKKSQ